MDKRAAFGGPFALPFGLKKRGPWSTSENHSPLYWQNPKGELYRSLFKIP